MLRFNKRRNTLEPEEYIFQLQDSAEPNLFRDVFPYNKIPKISFNYRLNPMNPPEEIWITDTTFRDGQQSRPPYTVKQIVDLYDLIHKLGGKSGLIRQCEFFLYNEKDQQAVRKCMERGYTYPEITGWIRAVKSDFKLVKEMGLKETGILCSSSDYHIYLKLNKTRKQAMDMYLDIVRAALEEGIIPRCHFEDITRSDFYGFVVPFAKELMKLSKESKLPVKIRACDTMGMGISYPGAALPRSVPGIIYGLNHFAGVPSEYMEWHGHNDFYLAVSNATSAWLYGCSVINGTLLGLGERTGNTP
ncbi:MAG: 2-isopropylmalate synthase, partial [Candidatus Brocadia sp.]|nr:2-isopropylmalate synthase [Candidatus Brocadia sp.]